MFFFIVSKSRVIPANAIFLKMADLIAVEDPPVSLTPMLCRVHVDMSLTSCNRGRTKDWSFH